MRTRLIKKIGAATVAALMAVPLSAGAAQAQAPKDSYPLTQEQAAAPIEVKSADDRVAFTVSVAQDGTDHGTNSQSIVTTANGFPFGDDGPLDGIVSVRDTVAYSISYNVEASDTPTTVDFSMRNFIENFAGGTTVMANDGPKASGTAMNSNDFKAFCEGGAGYGHTGQVTQAGTACTMTFPATTATSTTDAGTVRSAGVNAAVEAGFLDLDVTVDAAAPVSLENRTMIVSARSDNPFLRIDDQKVEYVDDEAFETFTVVLTHAYGSGQKGLLQDANHAFIRSSGALDLSSLPSSAEVTPVRAGTGDVSAVTVGDDGIVRWTDVQTRGLSAPHTKTSSTHGQGREIAVTVRVPLADVTDDLADIFISEYSSEREYPGSQNVEPRLHDFSYLEREDFEPGLGQGKNQSTQTYTLPDGRTISPYSGVAGYANDDWAKIEFADNRGDGVFSKQIIKDVGDGYVNVGTSDETRTDSRTHFYETALWSRFGAVPYAGTYKDATYCDVWDPAHQKVDTSREPRARVWDDDEAKYSNAEVTIEYGTSDEPYTPNMVVTPGGKAALAEHCDSVGEWSDTPDETTDTVRVVFDGSHRAAVNVPSREDDQRFDTFVHMVDIPFVSHAHDQDVYGDPGEPFPLKDALTAGNDGEINEDSYTARQTWVRGAMADPFIEAAGTGATTSMNSGTRTKMGLRELRWLANVPEPDTYQYQAEVRITIDSSAQAVELPEAFTDDWEVLDIQDADFGPDRLPGTDDDVSDWAIIVKKRDNPNLTQGTRNLYYNEWSESRAAAPIITLPSYLEDGRELDVSMELLNAPDVQGDVASNNKRDWKITVNARATIAQQKWVMSPRAFLGDEIGWGISWSNTSPKPEGPATFVDVLPYNGDGRGTEISAPLSDIRFEVKAGDDDVTIEVTDADPTTITTEAVEAGEITFVPLAEEGSLAGEITAFRITEQEVESDQIRLVEVYASTQGLGEYDVISNNLSEASVMGLAMPVPSTVPVVTELYTTYIGGTIFYDINKNGELDEDEPVRVGGTELVLYSKDGEELDRMLSGADGTYGFSDHRPGEFRIAIEEDGVEVAEHWVRTSGDHQDEALTPARPRVTDVDFGYWGDRKSSIAVTKSVREVEEGGSAVHGEDVTFVFLIENTGETEIAAGTKVTDSVYGDISCDVPALAPGETFECELVAPIADDDWRTDNPADWKEMVPGKSDGGGDPAPGPSASPSPEREQREDPRPSGDGGGVLDDGSGISLPGASRIGYLYNSKNYYTGAYLCDEDFCPSGQKVTDLEFTKEGLLVAGYGDWNSNIDSFGPDPVAVYETDPRTGKTVNGPYPLGTEAFDVIREFGGDLYIPTTDPSDRIGYGQSRNNRSGVWTSRSGDWTLIPSPADMIHTFDALVTQDETVYMSGSISRDGGTGIIYALHPDGSSEEVLAASDGSGWSRVHSLAEASDGRVAAVTSSMGGPATVVLIDPESGSVKDTGTAVDTAKKLHSFAGSVIGVRGRYLVDVDSGSRYELPGSGRPTDIDVADDGKAYVLASDGIYSVSDDFSMAKVKDAPAGSTSITVKGATAYVGTHSGHVRFVEI